ncbi:hypothetical protein ABT294_48835 [Nonomuraea sp. NPDC000554]
MNAEQVVVIGAAEGMGALPAGWFLRNGAGRLPVQSCEEITPGA